MPVVPSSLTATGGRNEDGDNIFTLQWTPPMDDGGAEVEYYCVQTKRIVTTGTQYDFPALNSNNACSSPLGKVTQQPLPQSVPR